MSKKHDAVFDDVLSGFDSPAPASNAGLGREDKAGARFLKRTTGLGDRLSGDLEEKTLNWVDPADCAMWSRHNRDYALLNEDNCRDLIDGIKSQGRQEFPAIVRRKDGEKPFEVICGARRHFAVSWLRANNYPQYKYLVEVRDLSDEEAFRLADIENRDREDISDYERAIDYADAIERYYSGRQKAMAERLEVSQPWLSRYLQLAKLPDRIVAAYASIRDIKERHARDLKPLLASEDLAPLVFAEADRLASLQAKARAGQSGYVDGAEVMSHLKKAARPAVQSRQVEEQLEVLSEAELDGGLSIRERAKAFQLTVKKGQSAASLRDAFEQFLDEIYS